MFANFSPSALGIRCSWVEGLNLAQTAGFRGADLNVTEVKTIADETGLDSVRELMTVRGLAPGGWLLPVNWRAPLPQFYEQLARLPEYAELAAELGCFRVITGCPPGSRDLPRREHWQFCVSRLRLVAEILQEHGHRLGIEFIGPRNSRRQHRFGFLHTMDGMLGLCAAIGTGNVGLLLDVWHWYTACSTLDDLRHLELDDVVYVHVNDAPADIHPHDQLDLVRCLPGETGVIPLREILQVLGDLGYAGPVTVEPFSERVRQAAAQDPLLAASLARESLEPFGL